MPQRDAVLLGATRQGSDGRVEGRLQSSVAPGATPAESETFRGLLDKTLESTHPAWIEHQIDFLRKADVSWAALAEILLSWLASQPTLNALEIAQQVILYAGVPSDVEILKVWPGTDEDLRAAMIVDLSFALRRRNHGRR